MTKENDKGAEETGSKKKGGKVRKFFLFAMIAGLAAWVWKYVSGRGSDYEDDEWQELPPPQGG